MLDTPDTALRYFPEIGQNKHGDPVDEVFLRSNKEGYFVGESGEQVDIYSYEVRSLPVWLDEVGELPNGYGYSGGVARGVLLHSMGQYPVPPRDMDVVALLSENPDLNILWQTSEKYMKEDWKHGHGVQVHDSVLDYLATRDFTLNEVLFMGNKLYFTERGITDLASKTIRPSDYEKGKWESYEFGKLGISPRLALKALMLQAEFLRVYGEGDVKNIEEWQWDINGIPTFYMALSLEKAVQRGAAGMFYLQLLDKDVISENNFPPEGDRENVMALAHFVRRRMLLEDKIPFVFTDESLNADPSVDSKLDAQWEKYYDIAKDNFKRIKNLNPRERLVL